MKPGYEFTLEGKIEKFVADEMAKAADPFAKYTEQETLLGLLSIAGVELKRRQSVIDGFLELLPEVEPEKKKPCQPHDFRDAHGADSDTCIKCGAKKSPRGRKRIQQLIKLGRELVPKEVGGACPLGGESGAHSPSSDQASPYCLKCGKAVYKVATDAG